MNKLKEKLGKSVNIKVKDIVLVGIEAISVLTLAIGGKKYSKKNN